MQTAERIITTYRRRRFIVCALLAIIVFLLTLSLRYFTQRNWHEERIQRFNTEAITSIERLLTPLNQINQQVQPLLDKTCQYAEIEMRKKIVQYQTIRSISLIKDGIVYCSSIVGKINLQATKLQPRLVTKHPLLFLAPDALINKGEPILLFWFPHSINADEGVVQVINIDILTKLMQSIDKPWIVKTVLNVAGDHFEYGKGLVDAISVDNDQVSYDIFSENYPLSISTVGPSANSLAIADLPAQLPLAIILGALTGYLAWLLTAKRMSFFREISLGLSAKEFMVFCQPLISSKNLDCVGIELLLRWKNGRQGYISPDVFIPLAEQQKMIASLTTLVLKELVKFLPALPQSKNFHIGINVAASQFDKNAIIDDLKRYWFAASPTQQLIVELTERDALPNLGQRVIAELHQLGVKLAIDDFGTGQSSLSYLETLSPDILKIDKSFTAAIGTDAVNSKVVDIIIALGHRLNITLIAEGVETESQSIYLRSHGVDNLQGYLYAYPMPLSQFPEWLTHYAPNGYPLHRRQ